MHFFIKILYSLKALGSCYHACNAASDKVSLKQIHSEGTIRLMCREIDSFIIKMDTGDDNKLRENQDQHRESIYLIHIEGNMEEKTQNIVYIVSACENFVILLLHSLETFIFI